jgi:putative protein-disulfide isomerase
MNLIYIGDPMCSWCYGFGKELQEVLQARPHVKLDIVVGGVRAGSTELLDDAGKAFRLQHWAKVQALSGLPFNREAFMTRKNFVYDTEPVCRAVVTARHLAPQASILTVFCRLQEAFYVEGLDTTDDRVLARLVSEELNRLGHPSDFKEVLETQTSPMLRHLTSQHFMRARSWGISSFPALMHSKGQVVPVTTGYAKAHQLLELLDTKFSQP